MSRIAVPTREQVPDAAKPLLDAVAGRVGFVSNAHRLMAVSPAVLGGFLGLQAQLNSTLDRRTREAIALVVSEVNGCHYCLAAHTHTASTAGDTAADEIERNRHGTSANARTAAAASFAAKVVEARGHVDDRDLVAIRQAGFTDAEILEVVALSVQFLLMNFINTVAGTEIDFPLVEPIAPP